MDHTVYLEYSMLFNFPKDKVKQKLALLLYSNPGQGKSVSICTLLKIPNLKVRILATERNCIPAIEEGMRIHGIKELTKGQLVIAEARGTAQISSDNFMANSDSTAYDAAVARLFSFTGIDVFDGSEINLGKVFSWGDDCVLVIDGMTMLQHAATGKGQKKSEDEGTTKDPRNAFYNTQKLFIGYIVQLINNSKIHIVALGHSVVELDEKVLAKIKDTGVTKIHPYLGTRSIIDGILSQFNVLLYAKYNKLTRKYVWSADETDAMTVARNIQIEGNLYEGKPVKLSSLPADFSYSGYNFF